MFFFSLCFSSKINAPGDDENKLMVSLFSVCKLIWSCNKKACVSVYICIILNVSVNTKLIEKGLFKTLINVYIFTGKTQAAERRQLCLSTQLTDEKQHLPAHDTHTGPPQWWRYDKHTKTTHWWIIVDKAECVLSSHHFPVLCLNIRCLFPMVVPPASSSTTVKHFPPLHTAWTHSN